MSHRRLASSAKSKLICSCRFSSNAGDVYTTNKVTSNIFTRILLLSSKIRKLQRCFRTVLTRFCECLSSCRLMVLPLADSFRPRFVRFATEYPPINVPQPGSVVGATALLPQRNQVASFQRDNQLAAITTVTVFLNGHAPDSFVQRSHKARWVCLGCIVPCAESPSFSNKRRISACVRGAPRRAHSASSFWRADCSLSELGANCWSRYSR